MDTRMAEVRRRMREFPCGRCGAAVGDRCHTEGGVPTSEHGSRWDQAVKADRLPLPESVVPWS